MANKSLFNTRKTSTGPQADTVNLAGGKAYAMPEKHALAQIVATGCLNGTFYASAKDQLDTILELAKEVDPLFVAKCAVYGRMSAYMKDTPAFLVAWLSCNKHNDLAYKVFDRVVDNGKMLRNYVQIIRSGRLGRKSLGSGHWQPKGLVESWLNRMTDEQVFSASVGNDPSLADILKMVHPRPRTKSRNALYGYIIGRKYSKTMLPQVVQDYEAFKAGETETPPKVNFQLLTSLELSRENWRKIAQDAKWTMTRMNLNTFMRHGLFEDRNTVSMIAKRLSDPKLVKEARCFPYQLLAAFLNVDDKVPHEIKEALQDAMEVAVDNVPQYENADGSPAKVWVFPDVSGSMSMPVTGYGKVSSKMECRHVAALVSACVLRTNRDAGVIPFAHCLYDNTIRLNPRDSIMTNAEKLASLPGGGTNCSLPLKQLNDRSASGDLLIYVSDNESWMDRQYGGSTGTMSEFLKFKKRNPKAKMVCIDIVANTTSQARESKDILNVGGFSDVVFDVISDFAKHGSDAESWVETIEGTEI